MQKSCLTIYCGLLGNTSVHFVTLCRSLKETYALPFIGCIII